MLHDQQRRPHAAYRMTLVINAPLGEYYGVQGTTWQNPPMLDSPTETATSAARRWTCTPTARKLSLVAWRTAGGRLLDLQHADRLESATGR